MENYVKGLRSLREAHNALERAFLSELDGEPAFRSGVGWELGILGGLLMRLDPDGAEVSFDIQPESWWRFQPLDQSPEERLGGRELVTKRAIEGQFSETARKLSRSASSEKPPSPAP